VVSRGAVADLSPEALAAVLVHERAHARGRHGVLIQPFVVWRQAFPFLPTGGQALRSVELLAEMLAAACRACGPAAVRSALTPAR
jgi:Zn-dependent protease with chaperone function